MTSQVLLLVFCLFHATLQASFKQEKDTVVLYQQFLESVGMTEDQFKRDVVHNIETQNKFKDFLLEAKPKNGEPSSETPVDFNTMLSGSPLIEYNTPEIIRYYGYPVETHYVTTEDGYNLEIHRIPFGKNGAEPGEIREPFILQHGLLCSSADWVMNPPDQGFAYLLADAGYDVWMPNARGNTYSKTNNHLSNKDKEFWMFSWNEIGDYDMPAIIDYVLYRTGFSQVFYSGHSMGTTMFFVMMDKFPEYNDKVRAFFAMAPVATVDNMKSPVKILVPFIDSLEWWFDLFGIYEFLPSNALMEFLATFFCEDDDFSQFLCTNIMFMLCGYNTKQLNTTMLPIYIGHTPAGASTKDVIHYGQIAKSAIFRQYDHGKDNIEWYGNTAPPLYDLSRTTVDTYFYWGENDWLAAPEDVMEAAGYLPNLKLLYRVDDDKWTHLDFMWGIQANTLLYEKIIKEMSGMHIDLKNSQSREENVA